MRHPEQVRETAAKRVRSRWSGAVAGGADEGFPWRIAVGRPSPEELDHSLNGVRAWAHAIEEIAADRGLKVERVTRRSRSGLSQSLPAYVVIPTFAVAAQFVGRSAEFARDRARFGLLSLLAGSEVGSSQIAGVVHRIRTWGENDVIVLAAALTWFAEQSGAGLTPREVPVPGMDSKWLTPSRQSEIALLLGRDSLGLTTGRPQKIHYRYIDPDHLNHGGRQYDVAVSGDINGPAYPPSTIVICENVDSAQQLPRRQGTIVFEGNGDAGAALIPDLDWVQKCSCVLYWGDMDVDGLSIVNTYRKRGLNVETILMDIDSYREYADRGVSVDRRGETLIAPARPDLPYLTEQESALLGLLCDPCHDGPRRIEQEQLPRQAALTIIEAAFKPLRAS